MPSGTPAAQRTSTASSRDPGVAGVPGGTSRTGTGEKTGTGGTSTNVSQRTSSPGGGGGVRNPSGGTQRQAQTSSQVGGGSIGGQGGADRGASPSGRTSPEGGARGTPAGTGGANTAGGLGRVGGAPGRDDRAPPGSAFGGNNAFGGEAPARDDRAPPGTAFGRADPGVAQVPGGMLGRNQGGLGPIGAPAPGPGLGVLGSDRPPPAQPRTQVSDQRSLGTLREPQPTSVTSPRGGLAVGGGITSDISDLDRAQQPGGYFQGAFSPTDDFMGLQPNLAAKAIADRIMASPEKEITDRLTQEPSDLPQEPLAQYNITPPERRLLAEVADANAKKAAREKSTVVQKTPQPVDAVVNPITGPFATADTLDKQILAGKDDLQPALGSLTPKIADPALIAAQRTRLKADPLTATGDILANDPLKAAQVTRLVADKTPMPKGEVQIGAPEALPGVDQIMTPRNKPVTPTTLAERQKQLQVVKDQALRQRVAQFAAAGKQLPTPPAGPEAEIPDTMGIPGDVPRPPRPAEPDLYAAMQRKPTLQRKQITDRVPQENLPPNITQADLFDRQRPVPDPMAGSYDPLTSTLPNTLVGFDAERNRFAKQTREKEFAQEQLAERRRFDAQLAAINQRKAIQQKVADFAAKGKPQLQPETMPTKTPAPPKPKAPAVKRNFNLPKAKAPLDITNQLKRPFPVGKPGFTTGIGVPIGVPGFWGRKAIMAGAGMIPVAGQFLGPADALIGGIRRAAIGGPYGYEGKPTLQGEPHPEAYEGGARAGEQHVSAAQRQRTKVADALDGGTSSKPPSGLDFTVVETPNGPVTVPIDPATGMPWDVTLPPAHQFEPSVWSWLYGRHNPNGPLIA